VNLEGIVNKIADGQVKIYSPDGVPGQLKEVVVRDKRVELVVPELDIYDMIVIN
jgi:hypothetical protein